MYLVTAIICLFTYSGTVVIYFCIYLAFHIHIQVMVVYFQLTVGSSDRNPIISGGTPVLKEMKGTSYRIMQTLKSHSPFS